MIARTLAALMLVATSGTSALAIELPWWVDSVSVSPPGLGGIGAVTLEGTWIDTGAPDAISHSVVNGQLHFSVSAPDLNVGTGDALTPWTLTEEFGPLFADVNEIMGSIYSVDPADRSIRELVSGPDFLGWIYPPPRGEFHGLGSLGHGASSAAYDVSANGQVVTGRTTSNVLTNQVSSQAFAWSKSTGMIPLGLLPGGEGGTSKGLGVSAEGNYVVGVSASRDDYNIQNEEAFRWSLGGGMQGLGNLHEGYATSEARATSRNGRVVVGVDDFYPPSFAPVPPGYFQRAFRYTDETGIQDLGTLPEYESDSSSEAVDVTANGRVIAGNAFRSPYQTTDAIHIDHAQPFLWTEEHGMQGIGNPARFFPAIYPPPRQKTTANAISADGEVVVGVDKLEWDLNVDPITQYPFTQAVMWTEEDGWQDLRQFRMPPGPEFVGSEAVDVSSETGTIVGQAYLVSTDATNSSAWLEGDADGFGRIKVPFIWDAHHGMRPLARVLAGDFGLDFEGWRLNEATAISDDGTTIVGVGRNPDGVIEAWRAVMHRNTRPGDTDFDGDVDRNDVATVLASMASPPPADDTYWMYGDFDGDGEIGEHDHQVLLANYDGRSVGDFNADGVVSLADYTFWRNNLGSETGLADGNGDNLASTDDYNIWNSNLGLVLSNAEPFVAAAIPEPTSVALCVLSMLGILVARRR
ncbi:hypothetical protein [Aeoliella sp.]|uniref:hypothetical protein n=1 Tax=Aeoliella sp. TaxID=2795800 RepID=UPI003CCC3C65